MAKVKSEYKVKPVESIKKMLAAAAADVPEKTVYRFQENGATRDVSYAEFREETLALGQALSELGVTGDHIAISADNCYRWIVVYLTVLQSKGVFVPIDKELPADEFMHVLLDSDSTVIFYNKKHEEILLANMEKLDRIRYFIALEETEQTGDRFLTFEGLVARGRALRAEGKIDFEDEERDHSVLAMLVYTSGTTGIAKGVMLSEHNLCSCVYYGLHVCTAGDLGLSVLPYHHTYEAVPGLLVAIHYHSTLCINENLRTVAKNLVLYQPEFVYLVPAFVEVFYKKIWANVEKQGKTLLFSGLIKFSNALRKIGIDKRRSLFGSVLKSFGGNLRQIVCGGAPLRAELADFFESIGIDIYNGYGITECSPLVSVNMKGMNDPRTVGMPLPCVEIKLDNINEDGNGEICVRGDTVMLGYYKRPDLTKEVLEEDGWFHTGDYGCLTKKGQLMITGRKKNLIVLTNGKNIFPEEIEEHLQTIPYIGEVVVFGICNKSGQEESLGAEVFLNAEMVQEMGITNPEEALKKDMLRVCANLPAYKHIARFYIRPVEFEKTTTNKIRRSSLIFRQAVTTFSSDHSDEEQ